MFVFPATPIGALLVAAAAFGQTPPAGPRFEAAEIRLATLSTAGRVRASRSRIDISRFELLGTTLPQLIRRAYRLQPYQNVTGPDWINRRYFDVFAKLPEGATKDQIPEMLQTLLAEQLKLRVRREGRQEPVCILSVGKTGPNLKEVPAGLTPEPLFAHSDSRTPIVRMRTPDGSLLYSRLMER